MGFYWGEGLRSKKSAKKFIFANSDPNLLNKYLKILNEFGIKKNKFKVIISLTGNRKEKETKKIRVYWKRKIGIKYKDLRKISTFTKTDGSLRKKYGSLTFVYNSTPFTRLIINLLNNVESLICSERDAWIFIRGLLEADGIVDMKHKNISEIKLAYDKIKERELYKRIIESKLGIQTYESSNRSIGFGKTKKEKSKWFTIFNMIKNDAFGSNFFRKNRLLTGFLNHLLTKKMYHLLEPFKNKEEYKTSDLLKLTKYKTRRGILVFLDSLKNHRLLNKNKTNKGYSWKITSFGKEFLEIHNSVNALLR